MRKRRAATPPPAVISPEKTRIHPMDDATTSLQPFVLRRINIRRRMCSPSSAKHVLDQTHSRDLTYYEHRAVPTISKTDRYQREIAELLPSHGRSESDAAPR